MPSSWDVLFPVKLISDRSRCSKPWDVFSRPNMIKLGVSTWCFLMYWLWVGVAYHVFHCIYHTPNAFSALKVFSSFHETAQAIPQRFSSTMPRLRCWLGWFVFQVGHLRVSGNQEVPPNHDFHGQRKSPQLTLGFCGFCGLFSNNPIAICINTSHKGSAKWDHGYLSFYPSLREEVQFPDVVWIGNGSIKIFLHINYS